MRIILHFTLPVSRVLVQVLIHILWEMENLGFVPAKTRFDPGHLSVVPVCARIHLAWFLILEPLLSSRSFPLIMDMHMYALGRVEILW